MDAFSDPRLTKPETGGERIATSLSFLSTPEFGGETVFPNMPGDNEGPEWSPCARKGLAVHPKKGSMVLFWNLFPNGTVDMMATHAACPVVRGEKWSAPKWLHQGNFQHEHRTVRIAADCRGHRASSRGRKRTERAGGQQDNACITSSAPVMEACCLPPSLLTLYAASSYPHPRRPSLTSAARAWIWTSTAATGRPRGSARRTSGS